MFKSRSFVLLLTLLTSHVAVLSVLGQDKTKDPNRPWTSPDGLVTLEIPVELKEDKNAFADNESDPDGYEKIQVFGGSDDGNNFVLFVLTLSKALQKKSRNEKFGGLQFVIGGDDDNAFTFLDGVTAGFPSREIIYKNQNSRGLFIDTGDRTIVLGLNTKIRSGLYTNTANRFFKSFHLNHR